MILKKIELVKDIDLEVQKNIQEYEKNITNRTLDISFKTEPGVGYRKMVIKSDGVYLGSLTEYMTNFVLELSASDPCYQPEVKLVKISRRCKNKKKLRLVVTIDGVFKKQKEYL